MSISVTILACNAEEYIERVLSPLVLFDEVVVCDTGSTDSTVAIAEQFQNVKICHSPFVGFGKLHNTVACQASHDWILSLDSDEVMTSALIEEILSLSLDKESVYSFPFHNYFNGRWIRCCGWYPDRHIRLYHRGRTQFTENYVHEGIIARGLEEVRLLNPVRHYSYSSISDFLRKMQLYTDLFAEEYQGRKNSSLFKAITHGAFAFVKNYFFKMGCFYGYEGYLISAYQSQTAFYKYLKLMEANGKK
ncbi:glycosyltransferase family 2 protein [Simkania negevensis]|uniref:Glycosyltransferase family 2 protein n=1 Tax=Simkania negevensis TaxID=83561 RepID=A0ABS3AS42_9BACT|nr:glycosyltransferase family 2 protein [Simkania negevensis]